jgi:hypothetical protein
MANYSFARGGNKRNFPWDNMYASMNTAGDIKYDGALPTRHRQLPLHFDGARGDWRSWAKEEVPTGRLLPLDTIDVFWINEGTEVHKTVVNVKGNKAGVTGKFQLVDNTGVSVGSPLTVDFGLAGYSGLGGSENNTPMTKNGSLRFTLLSGNIMDVCFDVVTSITSYKLEDTCSCAEVHCDVPSPKPDCFTPVGNA